MPAFYEAQRLNVASARAHHWLVPDLRQINTLQIPKTYFSYSHFNIILPTSPSLTNGLFIPRFLIRLLCTVIIVPMALPSYPPRADNCDSIWLRTSIHSPLSRKCGSLDISQPYGPLRPVTGIAFSSSSSIFRLLLRPPSRTSA
jgi:hypothetical protein